MFTQVVVFATPPLALVKATFLNRTPRVSLACFEPYPPRCHGTGLFSGFSTTRHGEGPFLAGRTVGSHPTIPGLGFGLYLHPVGARRQRAADAVSQAATDPIVMEPALFGPVEVQAYVPLGEVGSCVSHRRVYGGT